MNDELINNLCTIGYDLNIINYNFDEIKEYISNEITNDDLVVKIIKSSQNELRELIKQNNLLNEEIIDECVSSKTFSDRLLKILILHGIISNDHMSNLMDALVGLLHMYARKKRYISIKSNVLTNSEINLLKIVFDTIQKEEYILTEEHMKKIFDNIIFGESNVIFESILGSILKYNKSIITEEIISKFIRQIKINQNDPDKNPTKIYDIIFMGIGMEPSEKICNLICEKSDESAFKYLQEHNIFKFTQNTMQCAFRGSSFYIISEFVNMKYMPNYEDLVELNKNNLSSYDEVQSIINLVCLCGIKFDYSIVGLLIGNGVYIDMEIFDLDYSDELYFECYKKVGLCINTLCKIRSNEISEEVSRATKYYIGKIEPKIVEFRYLFRILTIDKLMKLVNDKNLIPDQYCYDYSFENENWKEIVEWLENQYGLMPTNYTFIRLKSRKTGDMRNREISYLEMEDMRIKLFNKYFDNNKINNLDLKSIYINNSNYKNNIEKLVSKNTNMKKVPKKKITVETKKKEHKKKLIN